jgi:hypothetical protein
MMVLRVDERYVDGGFGQAFRRLQSAETRAGDHHPRSLVAALHFTSGCPTLTDGCAGG